MVKGGHFWPLVQAFTRLRSSNCEELSPKQVTYFEHDSFKAAKVSFHGHQDFLRPTLNIVYNGGVGNDLSCSVHTALDLAKTQQDGIRSCTVQTLDHMAQTDLNDCIQSLVHLVQKARSEQPEVPVILAGHSLGTGLIVQTATRIKVEGLILYNGFERPSDLWESHSLQPQMKFLIGQSLDSIDSLKKVIAHNNMPLVVQTSKQDQVLNTKHGRALAEAGRAANYNVLFLERDGNHSQYIHHDFQQRIFDFINENLRI